MVWIMAVDFNLAARPTNPLYNGSSLAEDGVTVVSFNDRLGVFGFLGLDAAISDV